MDSCVKLFQHQQKKKWKYKNKNGTNAAEHKKRNNKSKRNVEYYVMLRRTTEWKKAVDNKLVKVVRN